MLVAKPEVMSPAGHWPQLHAAIEAGADAVYFGLHHFTARAKVGFELAELPAVMRTLHQRGVRGYLTFNTLIFDHELGEAARAVTDIARTGVDALIVQDVGVAQLIKQIAPDLEVHGSTQMSITSAEGVEFAKRHGVARVVLARELALDDIRAIRAATDCGLEMFVHGALCVSYSGQCFSSEAWGGRSANRGQCAQACRLPYDLIVDGVKKPLGDARYLLSPEDLNTLALMPEIVRLGVSSLKIEGRYKEPNYVAMTTAAYRQAVDEAWAGKAPTLTAKQKLDLDQVYSRGSGAHFVQGVNHQTVVNGRAPRHRGVRVGKVARITPHGIAVVLDAAARVSPIKPGDGLVFDAADWRSPQEPEEGGRVFHVEGTAQAGQVLLKFGAGAIKPERIRPGDWVWRSDDPDIEKLAKPFTQANTPVRKQPLHAAVRAHAGQPLHIVWSLVERPHIATTTTSPEPLAHSQHQPFSEAKTREQLARLGNTPYALASIEFDVPGRPFVPVSLLNDLRRAAVEQLQALQGNTPAIEIRDVDVSAIKAGANDPGDAAQKVANNGNQVSLHVLVRTPEQLDAALACKPASITLDYLELYGLRPAVERVQAAGITARVASPRVLKPNEQRVVNFLLRLNCDILVRSAGLLEALLIAQETEDPALNTHRRPVLVGDFSLNAANALTARAFLQHGLQRIAPTHDLNAAQIASLAREIGPQRIEAIAYHHLPVFHTEHCVFCRFMSQGTSYKDCGHPCEKHRVTLRDTQGREHPVMADVGCRNTVFGAQAQEASAHLAVWRAAGIHHLRLEFVHESAAQVEQVTRAFATALDTGDFARLGGTLKRLAPQGTTEGSFFIPLDYLKMPAL